MRTLGKTLGRTGLSKAICALMAVVALAMGPVFAITETVTSIAGSGNTDLLVWFEFDIRNAGTAGIVDLTGEAATSRTISRFLWGRCDSPPTGTPDPRPRSASFSHRTFRRSSCFLSRN